MKKILLIISSVFIAFYWQFCFADWVVWVNNADNIENIKNVSMTNDGLNSEDIVTNVNTFWKNAISIMKTILQWVLIIFLVYIWVMMVISMWTNEEQLSSSKRQLYYALTWLLFINIPELLSTVFVRNTDNNNNVYINSDVDWFTDAWAGNILVWENFWAVVSQNVITFMQVLIFASAILMFILAWIRVISSRWKEENITEWKFKFSYWLAGLFFVGIMEAFKNIVFTNNLWAWEKLYQQLMWVWAYFLAPLAFFFITMWGYYYLISWWDDSKMQKWKNIILYVLLGILIYISSVSILADINF